MWREIGRYKIVNTDGHTEEMILERTDDGCFRLKNEFGNVNIEFDPMSGIEFAKKMFDHISGEVEADLNDFFNDNMDFLQQPLPIFNPNPGDCDGQPD
jgi:hypothetical protein